MCVCVCVCVLYILSVKFCTASGYFYEIFKTKVNAEIIKKHAFYQKITTVNKASLQAGFTFWIFGCCLLKYWMMHCNAAIMRTGLVCAKSEITANINCTIHNMLWNVNFLTKWGNTLNRVLLNWFQCTVMLFSVCTCMCVRVRVHAHAHVRVFEHVTIPAYVTVCKSWKQNWCYLFSVYRSLHTDTKE